MATAIVKDWIPATPQHLANVSVVTGVYELRSADGDTIDIGYAGAREPFGLRSKLSDLAAATEPSAGLSFRYESHQQYMSRYIELVLAYKARHDGALPAELERRGIRVEGRLSPD